MKTSSTCSRFQQSLDRFLNNMGIVSPTKVVEDTEEEILISLGGLFPEYITCLYPKDGTYSLIKVVHDPGTYWDPPSSEEIEVFNNQDLVLVLEALGNHLVKDAVAFQREICEDYYE